MVELRSQHVVIALQARLMYSMASLAGLAYGWTWRKTGRITAAAIVHATVNFVWGILFGG
jgi:membrane protease YdiL (CAAX protease family)